MEKEENATKEAFNARAFAEFLSRPGGRETGTVLLPLGVPGDDGDCSKRGVYPMNQALAPIPRHAQ